MSTAIALELPDLEKIEPHMIVEHLRSYLQQVVTLHTAMFQRLLFEGEGVPLELAELFDDAGNTYITLSESISKHHVQRRFSQVEQQLDTGIKPAMLRVKPQRGVKPGVRRTKHLA